MKITAVTGSPSNDGNTCVLAREVLRGAAEAGAETEELFLADHRVEFCMGCISRRTKSHCMSTGTCIIRDDAMDLRQKLYDSDGIVLASPSYGLTETARFKNFMDRIGMYVVYTSGFSGKYFAGVSTCGGIGAAKVARNLALRFVSGFHARGYSSGSIGVTLGMKRIEEFPDQLEKARKLGIKLVHDIERKKRYFYQKPAGRFISRFLARRMILKNVYQHKDDRMKAVYQNLLDRGFISADAKG